MLMNLWTDAAHGEMIRITANRAGLVMPFVVDALKTPRFFADRVKVQTSNGRTAPHGFDLQARSICGNLRPFGIGHYFTPQINKATMTQAKANSNGVI